MGADRGQGHTSRFGVFLMVVGVLGFLAYGIKDDLHLDELLEHGVEWGSHETPSSSDVDAAEATTRPAEQVGGATGEVPSPSEPHGSVTWEVSCIPSMGTLATSVVTREDGGLTVAGKMGGANDLDAWYLPVSGDGVRGKAVHLGAKGDDLVKAALATDSDDMVLVGVMTAPGSVDMDVWLRGITPSGGISWYKPHGGKSIDNAEDLVETATGSFVVGGSTRSKSKGDAQGWLLVTDTKGSHLWDKSFGGPGDDVIKDLAFTGGALGERGSPFVVFTGEKTGSGDKGADLWIGATDDTGALLWEHTYGGEGLDGGRGIAPLGDGFVACGVTSSGTSGGKDGWLVSFDAAGERTDSYSFGSPFDDELTALVPTDDGGVLVVGIRAQGTADNTQGWVMRFDSALSLVWVMALGDEGSQGFLDVTTTSDGWVAVGWTSPRPGAPSEAWIVHIIEE